MQTPLSRIEREYILRNLGEALPPFSVLSGSRVIALPEACYECADERITLSQNAMELLSDTHRSPLRFCFYHKRRGMFFDLPRTAFEAGKRSFKVPENVFLEDLGGESRKGETFLMTYGGRRVSVTALRGYPLDSVLPDPAVLESKKRAMDKIAVKAGIGDLSVAAVYRLFEYLDAFSKPDSSRDSQGCGFIFIDHRFAIASFGDGLLPSKSLGEDEGAVSLEITLGSRVISLEGTLSGTIPIREGCAVACFSLEKAKEEDKRFLFERLYREKFQ